jgi:hypothetical protein
MAVMRAQKGLSSALHEFSTHFLMVDSEGIVRLLAPNGDGTRAITVDFAGRNVR